MDNVRHFHHTEVCIDTTKVLGQGVFGKCFFGSVGPLNACIKVHSLMRLLQFDASFAIPLLFGVMTTAAGYKCLLTSFHGIDGVSYLVHSLITKEKGLTAAAWKKVIVGIAKGLLYLHSHRQGAILHNDLKNDDVVVSKSFEFVEPCIIDFGKACFQREAKLYKLSTSDQEVYKKRHPQVAPEVRNGSYKQSIASDVYSFGRILSAVNRKLSVPVLMSMCELCLDYNYDKRPNTNDLCTFLENLFL